MGRKNRTIALEENFPLLQNQIKRDPIAYKTEFLQQLRHYQSLLDVFQLSPNQDSNELGNLITFMSHVAPCYPLECKEIPDQLISLLKSHYDTIPSSLRWTMVQALILLRNKDVIPSTELLSLFFLLFQCHDKNLRTLIYSHLVHDIQAANKNHRNHALNKTLQNYLYNIIAQDNEICAFKSLQVMIALYRKQVWTDAKSVNCISQGCHSKVPKIVMLCLRFFLGKLEDENDDSDDDSDNDVDLDKMKHGIHVGKKKKSKERKLHKALLSIKKKDKKNEKAENFNFSALHLLNDPHSFAEKLFTRLKSSTSQNSLRFEIRLNMMNLITRLIGIHKLLILGFYDWVMKYLQPHQKDVTLVLVMVAQSAHEIVPPDVMEPVVKVIADRFVEYSRNSPEILTVGLNSIREICSRCPLAMNEDILRYLTEYKNHKNKGVMNGARSLIALFREVNPALLDKKDRGKIAVMGMKDPENRPLTYGENRASSRIIGAEIIKNTSEVFDEVEEMNDNDSGWEGWEEASDDELEEADGDWKNVQEDETIDVELSDEEEEVKVPEDEDTNLPIECRKIFTPQDYALLEKHRQEQILDKALGISGKRKPISEKLDGKGDGEVVNLDQITGPYQKKAKREYDERLASIQSGREGREKYSSRKGKHQKEGASTTNKQKLKHKLFKMVQHQTSVKSKAKRSLVDKQKLLRKHIDAQKKKMK